MNIIVRTTLEQAIEDLKMLANPNVETFELNQLLSDDIEIVLKEIERLNKELQDTKEHLGEYLHEQEEENKRLNNIINKIEKSIDSKLKEFENNKDYFIDETTLKDLKNELQELKGGNSNENL